MNVYESTVHNKQNYRPMKQMSLSCSLQTQISLFLFLTMSEAMGGQAALDKCQTLIKVPFQRDLATGFFCVFFCFILEYMPRSVT